MARVQVPGQPTKWTFVGDNPYIWNDTGPEVVYDDDYVLGAQHTDGTGGKVNELYEDLFSRVGYVKRLADAAGNRGYPKHVVINSSRALTMADSGMINVATAAVGGTPSASVELTLPTRGDLIAGGCAYFERIAIAPFLDVKGSGVLPFNVTGYTNINGIPLKVKVSNPVSPPSPVSGDDIAQNIVIGSYSATEIYLYEGDYAEFVPLVAQDMATGFWYITWRVSVHNTRYQKFLKGAADVVVTGGVPTTNMEKTADYYEFAITSGDTLSYLPDNLTTASKSLVTEGARSMLVRFKTSVSGGTFSIAHNGSSAPAGYKKILTPQTAAISCKDGEIVEFIEDGSAGWRVKSYIGITNNLAVINALLAIETINRTNAVSAEASARSAADSNIQAQVTAIKAAWVNATPSHTTTAGIDDVDTITFLWMVVGKTVHCRYDYNVNVGASPSGTQFITWDLSSLSGLTIEGKAPVITNQFQGNLGGTYNRNGVCTIGNGSDYTEMVHIFDSVSAGNDIRVTGTITFEIV